MQLKWLEDFIVLAQERSFTRAAELRHVTHPAFGRRIRALEAWAGTPLVERGGGPVTLTPAGQSFLDTAGQMVRNLTQSHEELQSLAGRQARTVTLATGRTLARTVVADWLVRLQPILQGGELCIRTRALADTVGMLERNEADFSLVYHHPTLAIRLDARQFTHLTVASDRLVPVSRATAQGQALHRFGPDATRVPYLAYAPPVGPGAAGGRPPGAQPPCAPAAARGGVRLGRRPLRIRAKRPGRCLAALVHGVCRLQGPAAGTRGRRPHGGAV